MVSSRTACAWRATDLRLELAPWRSLFRRSHSSNYALVMTVQMAETHLSPERPFIGVGSVCRKSV
jgi:hypothetical protein